MATEGLLLQHCAQEDAWPDSRTIVSSQQSASSMAFLVPVGTNTMKPGNTIKILAERMCQGSTDFHDVLLAGPEDNPVR